MKKHPVLLSVFSCFWLLFFLQHGARLSAAVCSVVLGFVGNDKNDGVLSDFVAPLTDLGLIAATGEDAAAFLLYQLTNDIEHLDHTQVRLAGYCSPKGRLLATILIWKSAQQIMLQLPRQFQPAVQKRLQMFVLRAKAKLADISV